MTERSPETPWYSGPSLIDYLETVEIAREAETLPLRMPVQWVNRPNLDFRGFSGQIASGRVKPGDRIRSLPSGRETTVTRIVTQAGDLGEAVAGQSVTLTFADEIDTSRGDIIAAATQPPEVSDQFQVKLLWMSENPLLPGRRYFLKSGTKTVSATVNAPKYGIDVNTMAETPRPHPGTQPDRRHHPRPRPGDPV